MTTNSYPFQFVGTDTSGSDKYMKDVLVYTFVSQKSGHRYLVGAADGKDDRERTTRRFRVYMQFVKDLGVGEQFWPFALKDYSMCVLVNKNSVSDRKDYISKIISFIE